MIKISRALIISAILMISSGCASQLPAECPIGVPVRDFILQPLTVDEQLAIKRHDPNLLGKIAQNDINLKSHIRVLEGVIQAHDSALENCD